MKGDGRSGKSSDSAGAPAGTASPTRSLLPAGTYLPSGSRTGMAVPNSGASGTQRSVMDTIVQGALVDLLQSCGVAVAPQPRGRVNFAELTIPEVSSAIGFTLAYTANVTPSPGRMTLSLPESLFGIMKADTIRRPQPFDWVRELTNQLAAHIKHRLLPLGAAMNAMLPSVITREALEALRVRFPAMRVYVGRTLRGDVLVTLDAIIDESRLNYTGPVEIANAGDIIVF